MPRINAVPTIQSEIDWKSYTMALIFYGNCRA